MGTTNLSMQQSGRLFCRHYCDWLHLAWMEGGIGGYQMPVEFDRSICCDLNETSTREWLITNGVGGYAAGTVAGMLTRMEHGLLVSSPLDRRDGGRDTSSPGEKDKVTPQLLLAKIDEEVVFDRRTYYLGTNEYRDGTLNPSGFVHLETFRLEEGFPVFTYRLGGIDGIILEKRIWMPSGKNTTCIQYRVLRTETAYETAFHASDAHSSSSTNAKYEYSFKYSEAAQRELTLTLLPFSAYRPYNQPQHGNNDWLFSVQQLSSEQEHYQLPEGTAGCTIQAWEGALPYHILATGHAQSQASFIPTNVWYWNVLRRLDAKAGRDAVDDLYLPGVLRAKLWPAEDCVLTIVVTAEELSTQTFNLNQLNRSYTLAVESQRNLLQPQRYFGEGGETTQSLHILPLSTAPDPHSSGEEFLRLLLQAANRLIIQHPLPRNEGKNMLSMLYMGQEKVPAILSDYYSMQTSTRDTLIALPGLLLATGRHNEAGRILHWLARSLKQGLLPDHLPLSGQAAQANDYSNVDGTLWYFYALDAYLRTTRDYELLSEVYPRLADSIDYYISGTENGIQCDPSDGLLRAYAPGKALTWMNATSQGKPVTIRGGKPVEVNALWYSALSLMHEWSQSQYSNGQNNHAPFYYEELSKRCRRSFRRKFWNAEAGYLYDVVDGPDGNDASLRPNQLLAFSLRYPIVDTEDRRQIFEQVSEYLLTPFGLRTLAPADTAYSGNLPEQLEEQQPVLHQGSVWPWLLGPYIDAMLGMQNVNTEMMFMRGVDSNLPQEYLWRRSVLLLEPFRKQLETGMLGTVGSIFSGNEPHEPGYNGASALTLGEILRIYHRLAQQRVQRPIDLMQVRSRR